VGAGAAKGVDHEGRGTSSPEFGVGGANANCPPKFCHIGTKRSVLWPFKIRQKFVFTLTFDFQHLTSTRPLRNLTSKNRNVASSYTVRIERRYLEPSRRVDHLCDGRTAPTDRQTEDRLAD